MFTQHMRLAMCFLAALAVGCSKKDDSDSRVSRLEKQVAQLTAEVDAIKKALPSGIPEQVNATEHDPNAGRAPTEVLVRPADDPDRVAIVQAVGGNVSREPQFIQLLISKLEDKTQMIRQKKIRNTDGQVNVEETSMPCSEWALKALQEIGGPAIPALAKEMRQGENKNAAVRALGSIGDAAIPDLVDVLRDKKAESQHAAIVTALGKTKNPAVVKPIIAVLDTESDPIRQVAVNVLGGLRDRRAVAPLAKVLIKHGGDGGGIEAAYALAAIGDPAAIEPLIDARENADTGVQLAADEALRRLTGKNIRWTDGDGAWREWWNDNKTKFVSQPK